ncbi:YrhK family protein [Marinobacter sp. OP 3.4]|uniref:YrhK family protein n=1 Tax=Marinobacter sp. OP 3.4 TaxID=3076501 RepID=UPI002E222521
MTDPNIDQPLTLRIGHEELVIRRRYELLSITNDFLIAIWFLVGSILFLFPEYETVAIWLFIIGSFQFLIRPTIRLASHIHVQRVPPSHWDN